MGKQGRERGRGAAVGGWGYVALGVDWGLGMRTRVGRGGRGLTV